LGIENAQASDRDLEAALLTPLGRAGRPDDVARVVLFRASDLATSMTGRTLLVDAAGDGPVTVDAGVSVLGIPCWDFHFARDELPLSGKPARRAVAPGRFPHPFRVSPHAFRVDRPASGRRWES
jgi:hypothetical protein